MADTPTSSRIRVHGSILVLLQFDVCEAIHLDRLHTLVNAAAPEPLNVQHPAAGYVRYERPPVVERLEEVRLESGERLQGEIKYYDYGVLSIVLKQAFDGDWERLIALSSRWVWEIDFADKANEIVRERLKNIQAALTKPYTNWQTEDYLIFHIRDVDDISSAQEMMQRYGWRIAQVVRGDTGKLAESESSEVLQSRISYYENDLAVIGWNAAFLYDTTSGAAGSIELLEYANSQLLEFRHYDTLLTRELDSVYKLLDEGTGVLARWRLARSATRLHTVLLDVVELTEHVDNAIKFLSDMYSARFYKLAASKIGVPDYKRLVTDKVNTAEELYRFMVDQFNQSRAFFLELTVVIILVIELIFLFRGKAL